MNKNLKVLGVVVLLIGLAVAGWFLVAGQSQKTADKTQRSAKSQKAEMKSDVGVVKSEEQVQEVTKENDTKENKGEIEELQIEDIDTSNWKTYRNEEMEFEVKYPEGWEVEAYRQNPDEGILYTSDNIILSPPKNKKAFRKFAIKKHIDTKDFDLKYLMNCSLKNDKKCPGIRDGMLPEYWFNKRRMVKINNQKYIFNDNKGKMIFVTIFDKKYIIIGNIFSRTTRSDHNKKVDNKANKEEYDIFMNIMKNIKLLK